MGGFLGFKCTWPPHVNFSSPSYSHLLLCKTVPIPSPSLFRFWRLSQSRSRALCLFLLNFVMVKSIPCILTVHHQRKFTDEQIVLNYYFWASFTIFSSRLCLLYLCICHLLLFPLLRCCSVLERYQITFEKSDLLLPILLLCSVQQQIIPGIIFPPSSVQLGLHRAAIRTSSL